MPARYSNGRATRSPAPVADFSTVRPGAIRTDDAGRWTICSALRRGPSAPGHPRRGQHHDGHQAGGTPGRSWVAADAAAAADPGIAHLRDAAVGADVAGQIDA